MPNLTRIQNLSRIGLGLMLVTAGIGHLTFARREFQAQVPDWAAELSGQTKDAVVVESGYVEIALGLATVLAQKKRYRVPMGLALAGFFAAVFPGNVQQYTHHRDMPGLDTDTKRFIRLFGQPVLIAWALWSTGALAALRKDGWKGVLEEGEKAIS